MSSSMKVSFCLDSFYPYKADKDVTSILGKHISAGECYSLILGYTDDSGFYLSAAEVHEIKEALKSQKSYQKVFYKDSKKFIVEII